MLTYQQMEKLAYEYQKVNLQEAEGRRLLRSLQQAEGNRIHFIQQCFQWLGWRLFPRGNQLQRPPRTPWGMMLRDSNR